MNDKQTALKTYLTTGPAASLLFDVPDAGLENNTQTVAFWVNAGDTRAVGRIVNDGALGDLLGIEIPQTLIPSSAINEAIADGSEFPVEISSDTLAKLGFVLQHSTFDFGKAGVVASVEELLTPYPSCLAKFEALKTRPGTIAEHFGGLSQDDVDAVCAGG